MLAIYRLLLRLHPRAFRERFEEEMRSGFDDAAKRGRELWLICDATVSLFRQWVLRSRYRILEADARASLYDGTPRFETIRDIFPRPLSFLYGGMVSLILFAGIVSLSQQGRISSFPGSLSGSEVRHSFSGLWRVTTGIQSIRATPPGRRLTEWIQAYNSGDSATLDRFASLYIAKHPDNPGLVELRIQSWLKSFNRFGPLRLRSIQQSGNNRIVVLAQADNSDWWRIVVDVSSDESHLIQEIAVENLDYSVDFPFGR